MKKKLVSLFLALAMCLGVCMPIEAVNFSKPPSDICDTSKVELVFPKKAYTQNDLSNNFTDYAQEGAKTSFPAAISENDDEGANVVGIVLDYETEEPICNAEISVNHERLVLTGNDGRFQILDFPDGKYDWHITAIGYCPAEYKNYSVNHFEGTNIFTFYIDKNIAVEKNREDNNLGTQTIPPEIAEGQEAAQNAASRLSSVPTINNTVNVYYSNRVRTVDRESYLQGVVAAEAYQESFYTNKGLSSKQVWQYYCAQAIASNTFVEYAQSVYSNHDNFEVCSTSCCQAYDPTAVTQAVITAVSNIFYTIAGEPAAVVLFYEPERNTYEYFWCAYGSSCDNRGTKTRENTPALQAVSCTDLAKGYGGSRYGMCQMGGAYLAKQGYSAEEILMYYYTDCDSEFCILD